MPVLCIKEHWVNTCLNHRIKSVKVKYIITILGLQETELCVDLQ